MKWELEEGPLISLKVDSNCKGKSCQGIEIQCMQNLDPEIHIAIGLGPVISAIVQPVGRVALYIDALYNVLHAPHNLSRTTPGHSVTSNPCLRKSANVMRSRPKPTQAVCATSPSAV